MVEQSVIDPKRLKVLTSNYLQGADLALIDDAWEIVSRVHEEKQHFSGESYLSHVLEVASTLASMHLDLDTILAGLLHGVLKEGITIEELEEKFGNEVASIVEGSTKITKVRYNSRIANQAENARKMLLAIAEDIRVLLVKLADRLMDMFLLDMVDREQQVEIARETMDLYAPLASRLGIDWLKQELEDHSFKFLYPEEHSHLSSKLESSLEERQKYVGEVITILQEKLGDNDIKPLRIVGRPKHLYSIYKKLVVQDIPLERVYDKVAFRIITNTVNECYEVLGTVHANWAPVPGRIKDFISVPKANNYQSMHTTVVGPRNHFIEIQIRTEEMDLVAQEGVAAHWAYKEGQKISSKDAKLCHELKNLVSSLQDVEDPREFLDGVKGELYDPDVYALTPTGEVKEFPLGSCPIDFAYSIHTEVGDRCVGAKVNSRQVPLKYKLQSGDMVDIITSPNQVPRRGWLDLVKTGRARARIRSWLRKEEKEKALKLGREICEREIRKHGTTLKKMIKSGHIKVLLKELRCNSLDDMLVKVGNGGITVQNLVRALLSPEQRKETEPAAPMDLSPEELAGASASQPVRSDKQEKLGIEIDGVDGMLVKVSQCCRPVPGDSIVGFITVGRGVSVHRADCVNLLSSDPQRWLDVTWSGIAEKQFIVAIHITAEDRRGVFADVSGAISHDNANIVEMSAHTTPENLAEFKVSLEVESLDHLNTLLQHLRQLSAVITARRI